MKYTSNTSDKTANHIKVLYLFKAGCVTSNHKYQTQKL